MNVTIIKTVSYEVCVWAESMDEAVEMRQDINFEEDGQTYTEFEYLQEWLITITWKYRMDHHGIDDLFYTQNQTG